MAGHGEHEAAPAAAKVPAEHCEQVSELPETVCAKPARHLQAEALASHALLTGQHDVTTPFTTVGKVRWLAGAHWHVASLPLDDVEPAGHGEQIRFVVGEHAVEEYSQGAAHDVQAGHEAATVPKTEKVPAVHAAQTRSAVAVQAVPDD